MEQRVNIAFENINNNLGKALVEIALDSVQQRINTQGLHFEAGLIELNLKFSMSQSQFIQFIQDEIEYFTRDWSSKLDEYSSYNLNQAIARYIKEMNFEEVESLAEDKYEILIENIYDIIGKEKEHIQIEISNNLDTRKG